MRRTPCLLALAVALLGLGGCTTVLMEGARKTVEKRQTSDFVTDTQIDTSLFSALAQTDSNLALDGIRAVDGVAQVKPFIAIRKYP